MDNRAKVMKIFESAHLMVLTSYTVISLILIGETLLMSWEIWVIPIIVISVSACWIMHLRQSLTQRMRTWIFAILMMVTFF